mgnify:CR=1 FL=1
MCLVIDRRPCANGVNDSSEFKLIAILATFQVLALPSGMSRNYFGGT